LISLYILFAFSIGYYLHTYIGIAEGFNCYLLITIPFYHHFLCAFVSQFKTGTNVFLQ
jgi:hypothetical protein